MNNNSARSAIDPGPHALAMILTGHHGYEVITIKPKRFSDFRLRFI